MTVEELYVYFGSLNKASKELGVSRSACSNWIKRGKIPIKQQEKIENITKGVLKAYKSEKENLIYFPNFRYYSPKYGMCDVEALFFRKWKKPKITYIASCEKCVSFDSENLMQSTEITDENGILLFEKDIIKIKNGKKFIFDNISLSEKVEKFGAFIIIGNIFEMKKNQSKVKK